MTPTSGSFRLDGKVALVTGAGRGLGRTIALTLARAGAATVLVARTAAELAEAAAAIRAEGGSVLTLALDVTADGAADAAVRAATGRFGRVDILVMSAGVAVTRPALDVTPQEWDLVLGVNLRAAFFWSQAAARVMPAGGRIIYLSSVTGETGATRLASYCASKGGLNALTRSLALEWARRGITVNAIAAGYVHTALNAGELADSKVLAHITGRTPMRRLGEPDEVAAAALFLASPAASYTTGHILAVDGGWLAS